MTPDAAYENWYVQTERIYGCKATGKAKPESGPHRNREQRQGHCTSSPSQGAATSWGFTKGAAIKRKTKQGIQCGGHCSALALLLRRSHQSPCSGWMCDGSFCTSAVAPQVSCGGILPFGGLATGAHQLALVLWCPAKLRSPLPPRTYVRPPGAAWGRNHITGLTRFACC